MGVRLTSEEGTVALYDSVSDWALGPVFRTEDEAREFVQFVAWKGVADMRQLLPAELASLVGAFSAAGAADEDGEDWPSGFAPEADRLLWCHDCGEERSAWQVDRLAWRCHRCGARILCDNCGRGWSEAHTCSAPANRAAGAAEAR